jgi:poly(A) polymerase
MNLHDLKTEIVKDPILSTLTNLVKRENVPFFLVGGYLRDLWLGIKRKDYDFTLPREASSFISAIETAFGFRFFKAGKGAETVTFRVMKEGISMDIAFFQGQDIREDLRRRDFTVNALAFSLGDEEWHWTEGTLEDLRDRRIRSVSDLSLDRDPLRMLRAIRYVCTLHDFSMVDALREEISSKKDLILTIPGERIRMEFDRILLSQGSFAGISLLFDTGLLFTLLPEMEEMENLGRDKHHRSGVLPHPLLAAEKIAQAMEWMRTKAGDFSFLPDDVHCLYYATLFHDIEKQDTHLRNRGAASPTEAIMERLRFSNLLKARVLHLIRNHTRVLDLPSGTKETALKRLVHELGEALPLLVIFSLAHKEASSGGLSGGSEDIVEALCLHLLDLFRQEEVVHPPDLISGNDVMALGYQAGPGVGRILSIIRGKQVEGEIKTREEALRILREQFSLE